MLNEVQKEKIKPNTNKTKNSISDTIASSRTKLILRPNFFDHRFSAKLLEKKTVCGLQF